MDEDRQITPGSKVVNIGTGTDRQAVSALSLSHLFSLVDVVIVLQNESLAADAFVREKQGHMETHMFEAL